MPTKKDLWDYANTRYFSLKLNRKTDADIIAFLDKADSKQGLIKMLLREHIAKEKGEG